MPTISNPTAGDVHVNRPLTNFSQKFLQSEDRFVSLRAMPNNPVDKQSDLYYVFNRGDFYRDTAQERSDGAESAGGSFRLSTSPYFAKVYAFHKDVTDRQRSNQDPAVVLDNSAAQYVATKLMLLRERLFLTAYLNTGSVWGTDQNVKWLTGAFDDPIATIRFAMQTVHKNTGYRPNKMLIGRTGYDTLLDNDEIVARISGGATATVPAKVQRTLLANLFELDEIFVADSVSNTANEGATDSYSFQAADNCLIYYAPNTVGLEEPTAGSQFSWTGFMGATPNGMRMKRFRMEANEADRIEGQMAFDYRLTAPELGYLFTTVSA